jgi:hypothetical protein
MICAALPHRTSRCLNTSPLGEVDSEASGEGRLEGLSPNGWKQRDESWLRKCSR